MIGASLWLNLNSKTQKGSAFFQLYERKVNLKDAPQKALTTAFWMTSGDLFTFYNNWRDSLEDKSQKFSTLQTFSTEVRRLLFQMTAQHDTQGKACLPVCIPEWIEEAKKYGLEGEENIINLDVLPQCAANMKFKEENIGKKSSKHKTAKTSVIGDKKQNIKNNEGLISSQRKITKHLINDGIGDSTFQENSFGLHNEKGTEQPFLSDNESASFGGRKKIKKSFT